MPGNRSPNTTKRKEISLLFPRAGDGIDTEDFVFKWTPYMSRGRPLPVFYRLLVYRYKKGVPVSKALKEKPVYIADKLKNPYHTFSGASRTFKEKEMYIWKIEARDKDKRLIGSSEILRFHYTPSRSLASDIKVLYPPIAGSSGGSISDLSGPESMRGADRFDLSSFIPAPPHVFGCPVELRPLSHLTETEQPSPTPPPEEGEEHDPLGLLTYGGEEKMLFLLNHFIRHASLSWDYRHWDGCEQVLLQIAHNYGFQIPNAEDARADPRPSVWYTGPVFIDPEMCEEYAGDVYDHNLMYMDEEHPDYYTSGLNLGYPQLFLPDHIYIRLAPLDSEGNQIGPASDSVHIVRSDEPSIEVNLLNVEYFWGENPFRRLTFWVRLGREFPSIYPIIGDINVPIPITFIFYNTCQSQWNRPDIVDIRCTEFDGTPVPLTGMWCGGPAHFWTLDNWEPDSTYTFYLDQTSADLLLFTTFPSLSVQCIPGISPDWNICEGRLLDGKIPGIEIPCQSQLQVDILSIGEESRDLAPVYDLLTSHLSGRRVSSIDGEQHVEIEFSFSEPITNEIEFRRFLLNQNYTQGPWINMVETRDSRTYTYDFRLMGFYAEIWDIANRGRWAGLPLYGGRMVYNPDRHRLGMHFDGLDYFLVAE